MRSRPVLASLTAPVAFWYALKPWVARRIRVVPVSTMPAVVERMVVEVPKRIDWLIPQNSLAGDVEVMGLLIKVMSVGEISIQTKIPT